MEKKPDGRSDRLQKWESCTRERSSTTSISYEETSRFVVCLYFVAQYDLLRVPLRCFEFFILFIKLVFLQGAIFM